MSDALELVLRYFVAAICGWLAGHGLKGFADDNIVTAVTTIAGGAIVWLAMVLRGWAKSRVPYVLARLQRHHAPALLAAAKEVKEVAADGSPE